MALPQKQSDYRDTATRVTVTPRSKQIRNVQKLGGTRINDDFAYLQQAELPQNASNDEIFNADYQKRGLQPTNTAARARKMPRAQDEEYQNEDAFTENDYRVRGRAAAQEHQTKKKASVAKKAIAHARATTVNVSVFAWATPLWLGVQVPAAILSLITFAIAGTVNAFLSSSNILVSAAAWVAERVVDGVGMLFGFDINLIQMSDGLFLITYSFVLALGLFTLMIIHLQYTLALLRPLSGEHSGLKIGMFLLAIVGYSMPLLNLFPWALLWMAAVWKYPK